MRHIGLAQRIRENGVLGGFLAQHLTAQDIHTINDAHIEQWQYGDTISLSGHLLRAISYSILIARFPFQVPVTENTIFKLADAALQQLPKNTQEKTMSVQELISFRFKIKSHTGAKNKVNLYFDECFSEMSNLYPTVAQRLSELFYAYAHVFNDQATACVLMAAALSQFRGDAAELAVRLVLDPDGAKILSTVLKGIGANATEAGSMLCECQCLQGRAVGDIDLLAEARFRCSRAAADGVFYFNEDDIRKVIRTVLQTALPEKVEFEEPEQWWTRRWGWCVNGAHARVVEREECIWQTACQRDATRHRRAYMEHIDKNPLQHWNGKSYFTASKKLEHGKTRALFACDTITYACFEHLLRPVELAWQHPRIELDPGRDGQIGMLRRIRRLQKQGGVNVMLDYDDFNSQHSLLAMSILFDELAFHTNYNVVFGDRLANSFYRGRIFCDGHDAGYVRATLMSGHRATSFINSVLNYVYLVLAGVELEASRSIHVGDDVYISCANREEACQTLAAVETSCLRMNRMKQSVGLYAAEFLRVAHGQAASYGYVARCISSLVSGNWSGDMPLTPNESLQSVVASCWTLTNRTRCKNIPLLVARAVQRTTGLGRHLVRRLVTGEWGLGEGPNRMITNRRTAVFTYGVMENNINTQDVWRTWPSLATDNYLTNHTQPIEKYAMDLVGHGVKSGMLAASYCKSAAAAPQCSKPFPAMRCFKTVQWLVGSTAAMQALAARPNRGCLSIYPLIHMLKNSLDNSDLRELVAATGILPEQDVYKQAWGNTSKGVALSGWLAYTDACHLAKRCETDIMYMEYCMYV